MPPSPLAGAAVTDPRFPRPAVLIALALGGCASVVQPQFGVQTGGVLYPCPASRACVSSQETHAERKVEALAYDGDRRDARADLIGAIDSFTGVRIVSSHRNYLRVEFPSKALKDRSPDEFYFAARAGIDDVEFYFPPEERVIHVRSAARLGMIDAGENRERVEALRRAFAQLQAKRQRAAR